MVAHFDKDYAKIDECDDFGKHTGALNIIFCYVGSFILGLEAKVAIAALELPKQQQPTPRPNGKMTKLTTITLNPTNFHNCYYKIIK